MKTLGNLTTTELNHLLATFPSNAIIDRTTISVKVSTKGGRLVLRALDYGSALRSGGSRWRVMAEPGFINTSCKSCNDKLGGY